MDKKVSTTAELRFIGAIKTPYTTVEECPRNIQSDGPLCQIRLHDEFQKGLSGLKVGQHILILYWFENTDRTAVCQKAGNGDDIKGTFALRSPHRPNPVAAAVLPIERIEDGTITVRGLDCISNTPLIDIKPATFQEIGPAALSSDQDDVSKTNS